MPSFALESPRPSYQRGTLGRGSRAVSLARKNLSGPDSTSPHASEYTLSLIDFTPSDHAAAHAGIFSHAHSSILLLSLVRSLSSISYCTRLYLIFSLLRKITGATPLQVRLMPHGVFESASAGSCSPQLVIVYAITAPVRQWHEIRHLLSNQDHGNQTLEIIKSLRYETALESLVVSDLVERLGAKSSDDSRQLTHPVYLRIDPLLCR